MNPDKDERFFFVTRKGEEKCQRGETIRGHCPSCGTDFEVKSYRAYFAQKLAEVK